VLRKLKKYNFFVADGKLIKTVVAISTMCIIIGRIYFNHVYNDWSNLDSNNACFTRIYI
jgi:hypothetical protein